MTKVKKTAKQPKGKATPNHPAQEAASTPKLAKDKELVAEIEGYIQRFTKEVQTAAEKRGIEVDVAVHIAQKSLTKGEG